MPLDRMDRLQLVNAALDELRTNGFLADSVARSGVEGLIVAPCGDTESLIDVALDGRIRPGCWHHNDRQARTLTRGCVTLLCINRRCYANSVERSAASR